MVRISVKSMNCLTMLCTVKAISVLLRGTKVVTGALLHFPVAKKRCIINTFSSTSALLHDVGDRILFLSRSVTKKNAFTIKSVSFYQVVIIENLPYVLSFTESVRSWCRCHLATLNWFRSPLQET